MNAQTEQTIVDLLRSINSNLMILRQLLEDWKRFGVNMRTKEEHPS